MANYQYVIPYLGQRRQKELNEKRFITATPKDAKKIIMDNNVKYVIMVKSNGAITSVYPISSFPGRGGLPNGSYILDTKTGILFNFDDPGVSKIDNRLLDGVVDFETANKFVIDGRGGALEPFRSMEQLIGKDSYKTFSSNSNLSTRDEGILDATNSTISAKRISFNGRSWNLYYDGFNLIDKDNKIFINYSDPGQSDDFCRFFGIWYDLKNGFRINGNYTAITS